jgi:hypothetical protein
VIIAELQFANVISFILFYLYFAVNINLFWDESPSGIFVSYLTLESILYLYLCVRAISSTIHTRYGNGSY